MVFDSDISPSLCLSSVHHFTTNTTIALYHCVRVRFVCNARVQAAPHRRPDKRTHHHHDHQQRLRHHFLFPFNCANDGNQMLTNDVVFSINERFNKIGCKDDSRLFIAINTDEEKKKKKSNQILKLSE